MVWPIIAQACYGGSVGKSMKAPEFTVPEKIVGVTSRLRSLGVNERNPLFTSVENYSARRTGRWSVVSDLCPYSSFAYSALASFRHLSRSVKWFFKFFRSPPKCVHWISARNSQGFRCSGDGGQGRAAPGERGQIFLLIIGNPVFPAAKCYANPFEGQGSHRRMVVPALVALLLVVGSCPHRVRDGVTRPFVKTLPQKLGAGPAEMHPFLFSALLGHGRNPRVCLHFVCAAITLSLRAKCRQQARRHHRTGSRQRLKDKKIRMRCRRLLDLLV